MTAIKMRGAILAAVTVMTLAWATLAGSRPASAWASSSSTRALSAGTCYYEGRSFGSVVLSGSSWLSGGGVTVYSNGYTCTVTNTYNKMPGTGVITGMEWQCVELVNRLYLTRGWISSTWYGNGNQLYATAKSVGLTNEQPQGSITYLAPGDVVSYSGGSAGHVGIVNTVTPNGSGGYTVGLVNENIAGGPYTTTTLSGGYLTAPWTGFAVIGVIHAPQTDSHPTAIAHANGEQDVFWKGTDGGLWEEYWTPWNGWNGPVDNGMGPLGSSPTAAIQAGTDSPQYVFWKGTDNNIWEAYWSNGWKGPFNIGMGPLGSAPAATTWGSQVELWWKGTDGNLWEAYSNGTTPASGWSGPTRVTSGGPIG